MEKINVPAVDYQSIEADIEMQMNRQTYLDLWPKMQHLIDYNHGTREVPGHIESATILLTDEGKRQLLRWEKAFGKTISLMKQFNQEYNRGVYFDHADWRNMEGSVTKAIDLLEKRLTEIALEDTIVDKIEQK